MNIIVIPDGAMIVVPLIEKNGHSYLSPTNFSKEDNLDFNFDIKFNRYLSSELPSGVKGRISLFINVLNDADAVIILEKRPKNYKRMYNALNELILFGGVGCINSHNLAIRIVKDANIPVLKLDYPTTQNEIIAIIDIVNDFLKNLK